MFNLIEDDSIKAKLSKFKTNTIQPDTVVSIDIEGNPVSRITDNEWDFNVFNDGDSAPSSFIIKFNADLHNLALLQDLKERCYHLIWSEGQILEGGSRFRAFSGLSLICKTNEMTLRVFKGSAINSIAQLGHEIAFGEWKEGVRGKGEETIAGYLSAIKALEEVNDCFDESRQLILPDFERNKLAKKLRGAGKGSNPVIIPEIYDTLLKRLIDDVEAAHSELKFLDDVRSYAKKLNITDRQAVAHFKHIEASCYMSLSGFAGMRISELVTVTHNAYYTIDIEGIELSVLSLKTIKLEQGIKREDIWACAPICKKALEVLKTLWSKDRDDATNIRQRARFRFDSHGGSINSKKECLTLNKSSLRKIFNEHSEYLNFIYDPEIMEDSYRLLNPRVNKCLDPRVQREDGSIYWRVSAHSFRRSFAHFCVGHGMVSLGALKLQFKHVTISMTAIYSENGDILSLLGIKHDKALQTEIQRSELNYHNGYLKEVIENPQNQSGGFLKHLAAGKPKVLSHEQYEILARDTGAANTSTGYGRCFAGELCSMSHIFEPSDCVSKECQNLNINDQEAQRWKARHQRLSESIRKMMGSGLINKHTLGRELSDLRAAEKVMRNHTIKFERFKVKA
ncbi:MAG: integrase [Oleiphilaceae bacterium]|jgi:integrase